MAAASFPVYDHPVKTVAIIGAGPAGLMAAERLAQAGLGVDIYERMPSVARKFLMAGRGGLNLTHSDPFERFVSRYGKCAPKLRPMLEAFTPTNLRNWADDLGSDTFVGSSGRVFPKAMKASPLLRAWMARLNALGVRLHLRHHWQGGRAVMAPQGAREIEADAILLALGGASWPRLGSDGGWVAPLSAQGVAVSPLQPANAGFRVGWSVHFTDRHAGEPLKNIALSHMGHSVKGEVMLTRYGIEGGAVYAMSAGLRDTIERQGYADLSLDLLPALNPDQVLNRLKRASPKDSQANRLRKTLSLSPAAISLMREVNATDPKAVPVRLSASQGLDRAISTAGGIRWDAVTPGLELKALPGVWVAGEMLDWEAPTGGYLLQGCFATGVWAADHVIAALAPET